MPSTDELITLNEAADRLGVHYMTAYRYVRTGRLHGVKDGTEWRVRASDVEALQGDGRGEVLPREQRVVFEVEAAVFFCSLAMTSEEVAELTVLMMCVSG